MGYHSTSFIQSRRELTAIVSCDVELKGIQGTSFVYTEHVLLLCGVSGGSFHDTINHLHTPISATPIRALAANRLDFLSLITLLLFIMFRY